MPFRLAPLLPVLLGLVSAQAALGIMTPLIPLLLSSRWLRVEAGPRALRGLALGSAGGLMIASLAAVAARYYLPDPAGDAPMTFAPIAGAAIALLASRYGARRDAFDAIPAMDGAHRPVHHVDPTAVGTLQ